MLCIQRGGFKRSWGWYRVSGGGYAEVRVGLTSSLGKVVDRTKNAHTHFALCALHTFVRHTNKVVLQLHFSSENLQ